MEEKLVFSSMDTVEIDYICSVLKENNIPFVKKTQGAGDYFVIAAGNLFNNDIKIFVSEEDFERASELIQVVNNANEAIETEEMPEELKDISPEEEKEVEEIAEKTKSNFRIFILCFLAIPAIIFVIIAIINAILSIIM